MKVENGYSVGGAKKASKYKLHTGVKGELEPTIT